MRRLLTVVLMLAFNFSATTQTLYESFSDGDFTNAPAWNGTASAWSIVANSDVATGAAGSQTLRLSAPAISQTEYLSSQLANWYASQEWGFWMGRRSQACTNANQTFFWLYANESNLNAPTVDGYRIAIGDDTGPDEIRLQYIVNGAVSATVIVSAGGLTNGLTDIGFLVRVTRTASGQWTLYTSVLPVLNGTGAVATDIPDITNTPVLQGSGMENSLVPASNGFTGVAALHTTSATAIIAAEFDQVYFNQFVPAGIITGTVATTPFVLPNCTATAAGMVNFSTTGQFSVTNDFIAQLSDDAGSFAAPVNIGVVNDIGGTDPTGTIPIIIPAGTAGGYNYLIRIISNDPAITGTSSTEFTIIQNGSGGCGSAATDYYRTAQSGNWSDPGTWESSADQISWISATKVPGFNANTILIRSPHTVNIDATATADQLSILPGALLNHGNGISFTLNNGPGTDMTVNGTYILNGSQPSGTGSIEISTGGLVRVDANTAPGLSDDFAHSNPAVLFRTGSVYEWNSAVFTPEWSGRTYFLTGEIAVFRFAVSPNFDVGGNSPTIIHGILEVNAPIQLTGTADKTFVHGITGTADIISAPTFTGDILIGGAVTAILGGTGLINLSPFTADLSIVPGTTVTMQGSKTVIGNLNLGAGSFVELGDFNLTVTGVITGSGSNAFIRTNGMGVLTLNSVGAAGKSFPVGNTSYNPIVVLNGNGESFSVRVQTGIQPAVAFPSYAINRTWHLFASGSTTAMVSFQFAAADANAGVILPGDLEILQYSGVAWSVIPGNGIRPTTGTNPFTVATINNIPLGNTAVAYALGKSGGHILPLDFSVSARAQVIDAGVRISWEIFSTDQVSDFELQRSLAGGIFTTIANQIPVANGLGYSLIDSSMQNAQYLYRIKVNLQNGNSHYSNIVRANNSGPAFVLNAVSPNPVKDNADLNIHSAAQCVAGLSVFNMYGQLIMNRTIELKKGSNSVLLSMSNLIAGTYYLQLHAHNTYCNFKIVKQ
ncbi:MAG TPA: T9SS type A sorting domain-containing protein [Chitinophagaceae bacterium]|nr:T9SS type A sorting domain-containing protein [Chitinophagaceae bacterium]